MKNIPKRSYWINFDVYGNLRCKTLLSGNRLSGSLPDELGYLLHLDRLQIDENHISGPVPKSFANLSRIKHLHMNNNSLSGRIPSELSNASTLRHL
ncbi:putative LRR receptor-like serine/threonine-protein kinase [Vitis vinifera]|uniref:Putative LRR receptor-like serine/threonine-protein kinase n=1 Tax=Vitis vinifera TaxID=29760 RepID=A0A438D4J9_VITVI|nr:putative LRR receptor-like serine/threonine-protein kinase [Vitis vinifera]